MLLSPISEMPPSSAVRLRGVRSWEWLDGDGAGEGKTYGAFEYRVKVVQVEGVFPHEVAVHAHAFNWRFRSSEEPVHN